MSPPLIPEAARRRVRGTRLEPLAHELVRLAWPRWRVADERDNRLTLHIMSCVLREDSGCIDVGANCGAFLAHMERLAPQGRHHAFEPLPHLAAELRRRFPRVTVHEAALADGTGEAEFHHVVGDEGYSGLRRRTYARADERVERIRVHTCRLDDVIAETERIDFVKVDVEGAELEVFRGAVRTLRRCRPYVVFEHGRGAADHYGATPEMLHRLLVEECGLAIFGLDGAGPWSTGQLAAAFREGRQWNFLARPYR